MRPLVHSKAPARSAERLTASFATRSSLLKLPGRMMSDGLWKNRFAFLAGAFALIACVTVSVLMPMSWRKVLRENAFDLVLGLDEKLSPASVASPQTGIVVVD